MGLEEDRLRYPTVSNICEPLGSSYLNFYNLDNLITSSYSSSPSSSKFPMTKEITCVCGYKQTIVKDTRRKQNKTYRCNGCNKIRKLRAVTLAILMTFAIGMTSAYAETLTFSFETENLNSTNTWNVTVNQPDGSVEKSIFAEWIYLYPNGTEVPDRPVVSDPVGKFFELLIHDGASIFKPIIEPIGEFFEDLVEAIEEILPEPESIYTHEEQTLIDDVHKYCDKLSDRLKAIGLAHEFEYEEDQYYVDRPIEAKKASEDCKARVYLGNNVLGSMYNALAAEAALDAIAFNTTISTQGPRPEYAIDMDALKESEAIRAYDYARFNLTVTHGYGKTYDEHYQGDPVISTIHNAPSDEQVALAEHQQRELASTMAWKALCNNAWENAGLGTLASTSWDDHLTNGDCDNRILDPSDPRVQTYLNITKLFDEKVEDEIREAEELQQRRVDAIAEQDAARDQKLVDAGIRNGTGN